MRVSVGVASYQPSLLSKTRSPLLLILDDWLRFASLACRRAAPHRRASGSAALRTPAWHWQLPAKEAAAARAPSPIRDAVA
jgi:hypothetical protein